MVVWFLGWLAVHAVAVLARPPGWAWAAAAAVGVSLVSAVVILARVVRRYPGVLSGRAQPTGKTDIEG